MLGKNTILKAIHNYKSKFMQIKLVWMLGKNTILKAIHNGHGKFLYAKKGVNAG